MKNNGHCIKGFSLTCRPPKLFKGRMRKSRKPTPIFQPYEEGLPLESGYYSFVVDEAGRFRIERGNTSSHCGMAGSYFVGAAGHFWIARSGKVGMVYCFSHEHKMYVRHENDLTVKFVINAFQRHQAFELSRHTYFKFLTELTRSFIVSADGKLCHDETERKRLLDEEGQGTRTGIRFSAGQIRAFEAYSPPPPPRLHHMKSDQLSPPMEYDLGEVFSRGPASPAFSPSDGPLTSGRKAFILDEAGWLVVGGGHHILAGGNAVGAAGQITMDEGCVVREIFLNFSGHYRPPLTAEYARYTYRSLMNHPLLVFSPDCRISARKSFDVNRYLDKIEFQRDELLVEDGRLEAELDDPLIIEDEEEGDGLIWA